LDLRTIQKIRLQLSYIILNDWNEIINDNILPHIFLKDFDQIDSQLTYLVSLKNFIQVKFAIFDAIKGFSYEIIAIVLTGYQNVAVSATIDKSQFLILKKFCNSYPFYLLISLLLVFEPSSKNR
jgi:hypothetical protein